jgi:hypothetical protein
MAATSTSETRTKVSPLLSTAESHSRVMSPGYRGIDMAMLAPFAQ